MLPPPPSGTIRVWLASLDAPPVPLEALAATLAPDESARADRILFAEARARWVAARGLLRRVLGAALDLPPAAIAFGTGPNGRPTLAGDAPVAFNLSHSHELLAVALATGDAALPLGVDVERLREVSGMAGVAARVFDERERAVLDVREGAARLATFHRLWTRKEACIKATGAGFSLPPRRFHLDADAPVQRVTLPPHPCAPAGATLDVHDVDAGAGCAGPACAGAVAVGGTSRGGWRVEVRRLD